MSRRSTWRSVCSVLALTTALAAAACGASTASRRAEALFVSGNYQAALTAADDGLRAAPQDVGLWRTKLRTHLALGQREALSQTVQAYLAQGGADDQALWLDLALATFEQGLTSRAPDVQVAAIQAIERLHLDALADAVAERMESDDDRVAAAAAIAVLRGFPQAPELAQQLLTSPDPAARIIVIDGLGRKVGEFATAEMQVAAADREPAVRAAVMRALADDPTEPAAATLLAGLADADATVRAAAVRALRTRKGVDLRESIARAAKDEAVLVRRAVVALAVAQGQRPVLTVLASDPDGAVAFEARLALAADAVSRADVLVQALAHPDVLVREAALGRLSALPKAQQLPLARAALVDASPSVRLAAARALGHAGDGEGARTALTALLPTTLSLEARAELAHLGDASAMTALADAAVKAGDPRDRARALRLHRAIGRLSPGLVVALADPNGEVRVLAADILATVGGGRRAD